jgi:hypothetical protein
LPTSLSDTKLETDSLFWCHVDFRFLQFVYVSLFCTSSSNQGSPSSSHDSQDRHYQHHPVYLPHIYFKLLHLHTSSQPRVASPYFPCQCSPRASGVPRNAQHHDATEQQNQARHSSLQSQVTHPIFIYCTTLAPRIFLDVLPSNLIPTGYWLRSRLRNVRRHGHSA